MAGAKKMPKAGRAKRTAGAKIPPRVPGATSGSMRGRTDVDKPASITGKAVQPPAAPKTRKRQSRKQ